LIALKMPPNDVTSGKTYLELIQSTCPKPSQETAQPPPKSKRERAEENWKILDGIIKESGQYEKGSEQRAKCLERLHEVLRRISKRPRTDGMSSPGKKKIYSSAQEEFIDFLAPSCSICGQAYDGGCKCDELAANAESFLAPDEELADSSSNNDGTSSETTNGSPSGDA